MKITRTINSVTIDGSGTILISNNESGITLPSDDIENCVTVQHFYLVGGDNKSQAIASVANFIGYKEWKVKVIKFISKLLA